MLNEQAVTVGAKIDFHLGDEWSCLDCTSDLPGHRVGVERKTVSDFLFSLIDGRLFSQLSSIKQMFSHPLLLIEGEEDIYKEGGQGHASVAIKGVQLPVFISPSSRFVNGFLPRTFLLPS
jgi:ERCC4-type nuclease